MKHTAIVTAILVAVFILSQIIGLAIIDHGATISTDENGNRVVSYDDTALGERPQTEGGASVVYLLIGLAIGTIVLLVLIKFKLTSVWKLWYFLAVWAACTVSIGVLVHVWLAAATAFLLALWKILRPNVWVHNITEVLVYTGIAWLITPILGTVLWAAILLILIALYDAYAVWKSRHMVAMAQFQTESQLFAGLFVPYERGTKMGKEPSLKVRAVRKPGADVPKESSNAILGGGDIAFPLLFNGVVLGSLLEQGFSKSAAFFWGLLPVAGAAAALLLLFVYAKKDQFYPAMPFLAAGCFVGYGVLQLFV